MDEYLLKPFVESTRTTLSTMTQTESHPGEPFLKTNTKAFGDVTGIIGMVDPKMTGSIVISFETECILKIVSNMLMEEFTTISPEILDAVGEMTNIICGGTKASLNAHGYTFNMATPFVMYSPKADLKQLGNVPIHAVPFTTEFGKFQLELGFKKNH